MHASSSTSPLNVLLIGAGGIAAEHLPAFERYPEQLRLVGVCDPSAQACARVAQRLEHLGPVVSFSSHEAALSVLQGEVQAALIVTPHNLHFPQARACIEAGLSVLVEKPVCNTYAETLELHTLAQQQGVTAMAGQTRRFLPWAQQLRRWIAEDPAHYGTTATFALEAWQNILGWIASKPDRNADFWILDKARAGGGVVVSLGCHMLDLVRFLTGEDYASVSALGIFNPPFKNGAESGCVATLTLESGAVGTLNANYLAPRIPYSESFKLFGTRGVALQHAPEWGRYDGDLRISSVSGLEPDGWDFQFQGLEALPTPEAAEDSHFVRQLLEFQAALAQRREPESSLRKNLNTMAVIDALYESMRREGETVTVART